MAGASAPRGARAHWFAVGVVLLIAGCGFHPRGAAPLPAAMAITYIQGKSEFDSLNATFRTALESQGARVTPERGEASAILTITENDTGKDVLSVDLSGKVLEYRLHQSIRFEVLAADGHTLVEPQSVTLSRDFKFNRNDVLGKERETETIRRELQRDVVNLAMLRIAAASKR